jgi:putative cell wall-binding protein
MTLSKRNIPRRAVTLTLAVAFCLSLVPVVPAAAVAGRTLYVSQSAPAGGVGTMSAPYHTIQSAVSAASAGDTVVVSGGTYNERLKLDRSGTAASPVTIAAASGATVNVSQGIQVSGSYQKVSNLVVANGTTSGAAQVDVSGSNNVLAGVAVHDAAAGTSISITGSNNTLTNIDAYNCNSASITGGSHNTIFGGTLHHTSAMFIVVDHADYTTLENLDMHDPGQAASSLADGQGSDGIDFNASHLTIRGCKIHNVFMNSAQQHADAIQWWNMGDDFVFENNVLGSRAKGGKLGLQDQGHLEFESGTSGQTSQRVIIRNNVFLGTDGSYVLNGAPSSTILGQADNWQIVGNTFNCSQEIRGDFFANMRNMTIKDNVFCVQNNLKLGSGSVMDYNAYCGGAAKSAGEGSHSFTTSDPRFVNANVSSSTGYGANADWHLQSGSPLLGKGVVLSSLPRDAGGAARPNPPSVGAFEVSGSSPAPTPVPTPTPGPAKDYVRLSGPTRFETAVSIAAAMYPSYTGVTDVVITSGEDRSAVDGLSAAGLAGAYKAPLLLVHSTSVPSAVKSAIGAMSPGVRLHIVGGPVAVSDAVKQELSGYGKVASVDRVAGADRYETAGAVAREMKVLLGASMPTTALIANGADASHFYDALALSPLAYKMHFPILLVTQGSVPGATSAALRDAGLSTRLIGGGAPAVSESVRTSLGVAAGDRMAGPNRYSTAIAIANYAKAKGWLGFSWQAIASSVPDALSAGPMIGAKSGVILLTSTSALSQETSTFVLDNKPSLTGGYVCGAVTPQ